MSIFLFFFRWTRWWSLMVVGGVLQVGNTNIHFSARYAFLGYDFFLIQRVEKNTLKQKGSGKQFRVFFFFLEYENI